jgi:gamma-glutamylputrescine oxidase
MANFELSGASLRESLCVHQSVESFPTLYEATAERGRGWPALERAAEADCCVIGGGFAGLTTALMLARAGRSVALLEADRISWAASGRNGGFVSNGFALNAAAIAKQAGSERARSLYRLSALGTEFVRETILKHEPAIKEGDGLRLCVRHADKGGLRNYGDFLRREFGEDVDIHDAAETRRHLRSERYHDSLYFPRAFHIHPLRYGLLVARLAVEAGVAVHENTRAEVIARNGGAWLVKCSKGQVRAKDVIVCVAALDRRLHSWSGSAVLPVSTYVAATAPFRQDVIKTFSAIADTRRAGDYYRLLPDGRILWGGRITTRQAEPQGLKELMRADMAKTFPALASASIDYAWSGKMAYALSKMPLVGRDPEGIWFATGFGGHGLNTTAMAGILVARAIAAGDDSIKQFAAFAPRWAGGPFGQIGVQASYWWMQLQDRIDERNMR